MTPEEQSVLNQMYINIQTLLKEVEELKTYKTRSETAIRSVIQTNIELKDEISKLKSSNPVKTGDTSTLQFASTPFGGGTPFGEGTPFGGERTSLTPEPSRSIYSLSKNQLFTKVDHTKKN